MLYVTDNARSCSATYQCLDTWLAWSFTELATGRWLQHSPWNEDMPHRQSLGGKEIASGWRGIIVAFRSDEKAMAKMFQFRRSWVSRNVCCTCNASRVSGSPNIYTAFGASAEHRKHKIDLTTFIVDLCDTNAWVRLPGFHPQMIHYDYLHIVDLCLVPDCSASAF